MGRIVDADELIKIFKGIENAIAIVEQLAKETADSNKK